MKAMLLENIDELKSELAQDNVDTSQVPEVDSDSRISDIRKAHKLLRLKYDRKRCNSFGTELILAGAQMMEYFFDGRKRYFSYSPDLTGWHNTIRPKLRRIKYETSSIIANIMYDYDIGPTSRVLLELGHLNVKPKL